MGQDVGNRTTRRSDDEFLHLSELYERCVEAAQSGPCYYQKAKINSTPLPHWFAETYRAIEELLDGGEAGEQNEAAMAMLVACVACMGPMTPPPAVGRNDAGDFTARWHQDSNLKATLTASAGELKMSAKIRQGWRSREIDPEEWADPLRRTLARITSNKLLG